jgi:hypothetical protein
MACICVKTGSGDAAATRRHRRARRPATRFQADHGGFADAGWSARPASLNDASAAVLEVQLAALAEPTRLQSTEGKMRHIDSAYDSDADLPPLVESDCSDVEDSADGDVVPLEPRHALLGTPEHIKRLKVASRPRPAALCLAGLSVPALTGLCCSRAGRDKDSGGVRRRR